MRVLLSAVLLGAALADGPPAWMLANKGAGALDGANPEDVVSALGGAGDAGGSAKPGAKPAGGDGDDACATAKAACAKVPEFLRGQCMSAAQASCAEAGSDKPGVKPTTGDGGSGSGDGDMGADACAEAKAACAKLPGMLRGQCMSAVMETACADHGSSKPGGDMAGSGSGKPGGDMAGSGSDKPGGKPDVKPTTGDGGSGSGDGDMGSGDGDMLGGLGDLLGGLMGGDGGMDMEVMGKFMELSNAIAACMDGDMDTTAQQMAGMACMESKKREVMEFCQENRANPMIRETCTQVMDGMNNMGGNGSGSGMDNNGGAGKPGSDTSGDGSMSGDMDGMKDKCAGKRGKKCAAPMCQMDKETKECMMVWRPKPGSGDDGSDMDHGSDMHGSEGGKPGMGSDKPTRPDMGGNGSGSGMGDGDIMPEDGMDMKVIMNKVEALVDRKFDAFEEKLMAQFKKLLADAGVNGGGNAGGSECGDAKKKKACDLLGDKCKWDKRGKACGAKSSGGKNKNKGSNNAGGMQR